MRYLFILLVALVFVGCSDKTNSLAPVSPGLPRASGIATAMPYHDGSDAPAIFSAIKSLGNAEVVGVLRVGQLYVRGYGTAVDGECRGLFTEVSSERGYLLNGQYILTGRASNPGAANQVTSAPTAAEFNALVDRYNALLSALQDINLVDK